MKKNSAGILMFRRPPGRILEMLLVHPGGPFWAKKDAASWSIPKGEFSVEEDGLTAAKREFKEETGLAVEGEFLALDPIKQKSGKIIHAWAVEGDWDPLLLVSNTFELEWPRGSGKPQSYPEVDKAEWFNAKMARIKIHLGQIGFVDQLLRTLGISEAEVDNEKSGSSAPKQLKLL